MVPLAELYIAFSMIKVFFFVSAALIVASDVLQPIAALITFVVISLLAPPAAYSERFDDYSNLAYAAFASSTF